MTCKIGLALKTKKRHQNSALSSLLHNPFDFDTKELWEHSLLGERDRTQPPLDPQLQQLLKDFCCMAARCQYVLSIPTRRTPISWPSPLPGQPSLFMTAGEALTWWQPGQQIQEPSNMHEPYHKLYRNSRQTSVYNPVIIGLSTLVSTSSFTVGESSSSIEIKQTFLFMVK